MCGRAYETYTEEELYLRYLGRRRLKLEDFAATFNLAPTQVSPLVLVKDGELKGKNSSSFAGTSPGLPWPKSA